jgi:hypothetical protein
MIAAGAMAGATAGASYEYAVTIVNPIAEPASDSLRSLRRVSLEVG